MHVTVQLYNCDYRSMGLCYSETEFVLHVSIAIFILHAVTVGPTLAEAKLKLIVQ